MAHFAYVVDGVVQRVEVVNNDVLDPLDEEQSGRTFLAALYGANESDFLQTSYNAATNGFRGRYAAIGDTYDPVLDEFISPIVLDA